MKDKIRNVLLIIGETYMVVILLLMFYSYGTSSKIINIEPDETMNETLSSFRERINKVEEDSCREYLNSFTDYIEESNSKSNVSFQDYFRDIYINENFVLSYALKGVDNCSNITEEDMDGLGLYFLNASMFEDSIINYYAFQYELKLPDLYNRMIMEPSTVSVSNTLKYRNEIEVLKIELDLVEGGINNEI